MRVLKRFVQRPTESIRTRLLLVFLGITVTAAISLSAVAYGVTRMASREAQRISSKAMLEQAEEYLVQHNQHFIHENDLILEGVKQQAQNVASFTAAIFDNPEAFSPANYWSADQHLSILAEGQYANSPDEPSSVFVPTGRVFDEQVLRDLELSAYLDLVFSSAFDSAPNIAAIYFATPRDVVRYFPNIDLGTALPADFQASQRIWFTGSTAAENPDREAWWTPTYLDATGRGLVTTIAVPVYNKADDLIGVAGFDYELSGLKNNIESSMILSNGYAFLIDETGQAIALPDQGYRDFFGQQSGSEEGVANMSAAKPAFETVLAGMMNGETGFERVELGGRNLFIAYAPLESSRWSMGSVVEENSLLAGISAMKGELNRNYEALALTRALPLVALILLAGLLFGFMMINRLLKPLQKLVVDAHLIGEGQWEINVPEGRNDEIGRLGRAMKSMATQLGGFVRELENRVQSRTRALQASAEISRRLSTILDRNDLVREVVVQLQTDLNYYHTHIYLLDEEGDHLVMVEGTGQVGKELVDRGHKIAMGKGLIGRAAEVNVPVLVPDVSQSNQWLPNALLPETKSELAVPIAIGQKVLGVLDVQHDALGGLDQADGILVQSIASQVAIALQNSDSYHQAQRKAEREATISSIVGQIQSTASVQDALKITVRELGRALKAPKVKVRLGVDGEPAYVEEV